MMNITCTRHGDVEHRYYGTGKWRRLRCYKCASEAVQRRRDKLKILAVEYKGGKCQICGYDKCISALEFHHVDPSQKDFGIGSKGYTRSFERVKVELDKCICVCANCHREIHAGLRSEIAQSVEQQTVNRQLLQETVIE